MVTGIEADGPACLGVVISDGESMSCSTAKRPPLRKQRLGLVLPNHEDNGLVLFIHGIVHDRDCDASVHGHRVDALISKEAVIIAAACCRVASGADGEIDDLAWMCEIHGDRNINRADTLANFARVGLELHSVVVGRNCDSMLRS